jgi:hypothetical protein
MDNWLANIVDDMDSLHVKINNLNNPLIEFYFIRSTSKRARAMHIYTFVQ